MEDINTLHPRDETSERFNARVYLDDFRQTMLETGQTFSGQVKAAHKEELSAFVSDAELIVREQVTRTKRILPEDTPSSFFELEEPYVAGFTRMARGMGISALRLADKGNTQFATVLCDSKRRQNVLRALAVDFRSLAWHLESESIEDFNVNVFKQYVVLYHHRSLCKELQRDFPIFSPSELKAAVIGRPKDPRSFLTFATKKVQELSAIPDYEDIPLSMIKHAVFIFCSHPEDHLDHIIATTEELSAEPKYADFGSRGIRYLASRNTKTSPRTVLDKVIDKAEKLQKDSRYKGISPTLIKEAVLISPDNVDDTLNNALKTIDMIKDNPRFSIFSPSDITREAVGHPKNTAKFLEDARKLFDNLRADPKYSELGSGCIKDVVLSHTKNPRKFLDLALEKIDQLLANPKFGVFGRGYITDTVVRRPITAETYFDGILEQVESYRADPFFAAVETSTIRRLLLKRPMDADKLLRKIAHGKN